MVLAKKTGSGRVSQEAESLKGFRDQDQSSWGDSAGGRAARGLGDPQPRQPWAMGQDTDVEMGWTRRCGSFWDELGWTLVLPGPRGTEVLLAPEETSAHWKELTRSGRTG